jgi:MFS family permease
MTIGICASIVGAIGIVSGVFAGSLAVMIIGQVIAGVGFGASFSAALRLIFPLAAAHQRAGVVAGIYVVAYVAFGLPVVIAGQLAAPLGLVPTVVWYGAVTVLLALISLIAQNRIKRSARNVIGLVRSSDLRTSGASVSEQDETLLVV